MSNTEKKSAVLNLSVQLNDFWSDHEDEQSLEDQLRGSIVSEILRSIRSKVNESIDQLIKEEFGQKLQETIKPMISGRLEQLINTESIAVSGKEVKISEHLQGLFHSSSHWNNYQDTVKKLAESWATQLKKNYDMAFANQLVQKLNENGLLLPDVAKRLLDNKAE